VAAAAGSPPTQGPAEQPQAPYGPSAPGSQGAAPVAPETRQAPEEAQAPPAQVGTGNEAQGREAGTQIHVYSGAEKEPSQGAEVVRVAPMASAPTESQPSPQPPQQPSTARGVPEERVLFYKPALQFVGIDQQKGPLNPGSLIITDRAVYFLAKSRAVAASFLLTAPLAFAAYKALTSADISSIQAGLASDGSFYAERESLISVSAKPSGWLSAGEIVLSFSRPITPRGSTLSGYSVRLTTMAKGGGMALNKDDVRALTSLAPGGQPATQAAPGAGITSAPSTYFGAQPAQAIRQPLFGQAGQTGAQGAGAQANDQGQVSPAQAAQPQAGPEPSGVQQPKISQAPEAPNPVTPPEAEEPAGQQSALPEERLIGVIPYALHFEGVVSLLFTDRRVIMANPKDVAGLSARSAGTTGDALATATTLAFGVVGLEGDQVNGIARRKAWSDLKKKMKEHRLPPVIRLDQPFLGIEGKSIEYQSIKKVSVKSATPRVVPRNDWQLVPQGNPYAFMPAALQPRYQPIRKVPVNSNTPRGAPTSDWQLVLYQVKRSHFKSDPTFLVDRDWARQVSDFLASTPLGPKLSR